MFNCNCLYKSFVFIFQNTNKSVINEAVNNNKPALGRQQIQTKKDEKSKTVIVNKFSALYLLDTSNEEDQT